MREDGKGRNDRRERWGRGQGAIVSRLSSVKGEKADYSRERNGGLQSRAKWRITVESKREGAKREM